jgi:KipI family sensor histidine kinase inhibitor
MRYPRVLPVGDAAATVELGDAIDPALNAAVRALDRSLRERPLPGLVETQPTYRSLLVSFDPRAASHAEMALGLLERARLGGDPLPNGPLRTIPTVYGGEHGPDLPAVAAQCGLREDEVVRLHASAEYTAFMVGFRPGFAYLGTTAEALTVPRLTTPRLRVPAGSVALAGRQTGVYPAASPGGWRLIGRTAARLFNPGADPPSLIQPGDRVRFARVDALDPAPLAPPGRSRLDPALEVLSPGLLTSVQGEPRRGHRRSGIVAAGPLDVGSHAAANRAVGNAQEAAALEVTLVGPTLRFLRRVRVAIAGADLTPVLERSDLGTWTVPGGRAFLARPGNVLRFEGRRGGCRAYVAFAGGLDVPLVLGSSSTDLGGGFGGHEGRALRAGDLLAVATGRDPAPGLAEAIEAVGPTWPPDDATLTLRVVMGPQDGHFPESTRDRFLGVDFDLTAASDRVGCRLRGPALEAAGPGEIVSDGMVPGSVQVPPDGHPIVMLADGPTTGGYPKIATVVTADLPRLAQLVPGQGRVRFAAVGAS